MRKSGFKIFLVLMVTSLLLATSARAVLAGPHYTLTPSSGSGSVGSDMHVIVGIDTGTEKMIGGDLQMTFDASKLELTSVTKVGSPAFNFQYNQGDAIIDNSVGTFALTLSPFDSSVYSGVIANGQLLDLTFRPKATGTATVAYTCVAGAIARDTNIINTTSADVIDCPSNQSGSYSISAATGGGGSSSTPTPVPTSAGVVATTTPSTLPSTGNLTATMFMVVFGVISVVGGAILRWL